MTRVEELSLRLLDGDLGDAEAEELRQILAADPGALRVHLQLMELEAQLRGLRDTLDLEARVVEQLMRRQEARIEEGVMSQVREIGPRRKRTRRGRRPPASAALPWIFAALAAASLLLAIFVSGTTRHAPPPRAVTKAPAPPPPHEEPPSPQPAPLPPPTPMPAPAPAAPREPKALPSPEPPAPPPPAPVPEAPPPAPAPRPPHPAETVVAVAELESTTGEVRIAGPEAPAAAPRTQIRQAHAVQTGGAGSSAVLRLPDGTRLRLGENGAIEQIDPQRRVVVSRGVVKAEVARQAPGASVTFVTPNGEAKVLGTVLTLHVFPTWTRLEVAEGKVRLSRDGAAADVAAGFFALAAPGLKLQARPLPPGGAVAGFALVDAESGRPLSGFDPIPDQATIDPASLPARKLNIRAYTAPGPVGSVRFELDGAANFRVEKNPPYELASELGQNPFSWPPAPGLHVLSATAYASADGTGAAGGTFTLTFRISDRK